MKTFIFSMESSRQVNTGGRKQSVAIYRLKQNVPHYITSCEWNTASYKGDVSAVMNKLCKINEIPRKFRGYYREQGQRTFRIYRV